MSELTDMLEKYTEDEGTGTGTENIETGEDNQEKYTKDDEGKARKTSMDLYKQYQAKNIVNESQTEYKKRFDEQENTIKELNKRLDGLQKKYDTKLSQNDDMRITEEIINEENKLQADPILSKYYNKDEVRKHYTDMAEKEKRWFSPYESWAILNARKLLEKINEYEESNMRRKGIMSSPFGADLNQNIEKDELSDVKDSNSAYQASLKAAKKWFGD